MEAQAFNQLWPGDLLRVEKGFTGSRAMHLTGDFLRVIQRDQDASLTFRNTRTRTVQSFAQETIVERCSFIGFDGPVPITTTGKPLVVCA